tara:strand:- start:402 stop:545 length:144 start_codon:yes stop_codon:yes gene_type:complete
MVQPEVGTPNGGVQLLGHQRGVRAVLERVELLVRVRVEVRLRLRARS